MTAGIANHLPQSTRADSAPECSLKLKERLMVDQISIAGQKEAFMNLIAQELVRSMLGNGTAGEADIMIDLQEKLKRSHGLRHRSKRRTSASKRAKGRKESKQNEDITSPDAQVNLEEIFYAQVAGEESSSLARSAESQRNHVREFKQKLDGGDSDGDGDDDSFAGGCLDDLVDASHHSRYSGTSTSSGESELDLDGFREIVMSSIPQAVRDQIPASAWGQIFASEITNRSESKSKSSSKSKSDSTRSSDTPVRAIGSGMFDGGFDDMSEISAVTRFNTAFPDGKRVERKLEAMVKNVDVDFGRELADIEIKIPAVEVAEATTVYSEGPSEASFFESDQQRLGTVMDPDVSVISAHRRTKKVAFSYVTLRYYERVLTDNPSVQSGPAIGLGWRFKRAGRFDVDQFEQARGLPRRSDELVLSRNAREKILTECGYNHKEIADMVRVILKVKNQRKTTINNIAAQGIEETVENARKTVGRLFSFGKSTDIL